ncbi:MAG: ABC transporter permease [Clostridia bacterium]|nr:ABC transporter permease [Clostridia bacterium]
MISLIVGTVSLATVFLFGCIGEIVTEKAGHLNLGIPGIMCMGTAGGCWGVYLYMAMFNANPSWFLLVIFALHFAALFGATTAAIYAFLTISLHCNQNITGLAITTFGAGFTQFFIDTYIDRTHFDAASKLISKGMPIASKMGWFGEIFLSYGVFVYFAIALAVLTSIFFKKTRAGLHLRSIGENPATADAAGINVTLYKYLAVIIGGGIAALGGMFYIMDYIGGSWENASTIEALGWLSVALVIFSMWKPSFAILGSIIFACFYILAFKLTGITFTQMALLKLLPYVVTIIVLIVTSVIGSKGVQPPASLGQNYFREER